LERSDGEEMDQIVTYVH